MPVETEWRQKQQEEKGREWEEQIKEWKVNSRDECNN
jgi:hypothetical protein